MRRVCFLIFFSSFSLFAQEGIKYVYFEIPSSYFAFIKKPHSVHVIEVDPSLFEIKPVKALDQGLGTETVLSINNRHHATAAINGSFFTIGGPFDGLSKGVLKIHNWYSCDPNQRGCIGWSFQDQAPKFDRLEVAIQALYKQTPIIINGLNRPRKSGEMILFTPSFHKTTLTNSKGEEITISKGTIQEISKRGNSKIPEEGYVLSVSEKHPLFGSFKVGSSFSFSIHSASLIENPSSIEWDSLEYMVGGAPLLLHQGVKIINFSAERTLDSFLTHRYARTAIGVLSNGNWIFVVVEKKDLFDGMTIYELRDFMAELGCVHALNLDGGGSSTMVYEGMVKNISRDEMEGFQKSPRPVSDAILIIAKNSEKIEASQNR